jgi:hypothetical protein
MPTSPYHFDEISGGGRQRIEGRQESPADASNPNLCLKDPSVTPAVTGSKTAIVAIGNADSHKPMNVRAGSSISVSVEDETDVEKGAVDGVKEIGAEKYLR